MKQSIKLLLLSLAAALSLNACSFGDNDSDRREHNRLYEQDNDDRRDDRDDNGDRDEDRKDRSGNRDDDRDNDDNR
ncbi:hypothetical protein [Neisseria animaloris]|uniref:hypothetical protein n=1 Tax=Neisseria animaloris TaxID=326522 RepID=UPI000D31CEAB|nr:hypothetical protein [Neisseria animaloris]